MVASLDGTDLRLLRELKENARENIASLSKKLGIPRTTVHYRIKKLVEEGVIEKFTVKPNYKKLNLGTTAFILARYEPDSGLSQREVAERIAALEGVYEVHIIAGEWDLLIKVRAPSSEEVGKIVVDRLREIKGVGQTVTMVSFVTVKEEL
ncbi:MULTISPECIES: Lrp/AsnC family transcriptional regulator [Thermococcus]|uniref:Transcriptional regulator n=2 Tax=Thermococcus TaxID=2263 RepID=A0A2Z2ML33_9EURY|nr:MULTISPECIES: Lrp/AsnC family transcriptional regulator [Thermococcus]ASA78404.1 transcriptional regulator [Thermococcus sp. 5-4]ASJ05472.1 transcriptional regulator [Thermococcus barossii]ASJ15141.1 transcriptional regulator [Thermococcus radiotolerans]NJE10918.1 Lrp/AsnC family transcriptional regulator [Thermococcus sp. MAR1]NJE61913.1 Lrp/AsnC family transcriptional regulator [Thermococcus sp. 21S7]